MNGPLTGLRVIEFGGIGPGPFCGMMLADHGAEVLQIVRQGPQLLSIDPPKDFLNRSKKVLTLDLKDPRGVSIARQLCARADGLVEGFRPGVMERLGLGPAELLADRPSLVYGRMTGWGQTGPLAQTAGHDINYIALSGALHAIGVADSKPVPPLSLVGDFGGGGLMLAFGMVSALLNVARGGDGQVVDCAMTEGSAVLMAATYAYFAQGYWKDTRGTNIVDSGAHFYDTYETMDGKYLAVGAIEPAFYESLLKLVGVIDGPIIVGQHRRPQWPAFKQELTAIFKTKTLADWTAIFEGSDACATPVLSLAEAPLHPHNVVRGAFVEADGAFQPAPAPRYSSTATRAPSAPEGSSQTMEHLLNEAGLSKDDIAHLRAEGVVG